MNFKKFFSFLVLFFAFVAVQTAGTANNPNNNQGLTIGGSSPTVNYAPNGDRTSPYPPYYHPEM